MTSGRTPTPDMAGVKSQCVTAVATVAGLSGILMTWFLGVFHQAAACAEGLLTIGCGWRSALYVRVTFSVEGLLTTVICPLACAGLAAVLTMRFVGRAGRSATGVRNFAIVAIASMAAVSVTAGPAMGLAIVDSMTVPGDRRYSEGLLGTFALIAGICLTLAIGALVGTVVAPLRGGEGRTGTGRLGLFLVLAATLAATIPVSVLWTEYGHPDLPMIHFPRPVEAGIWFAIVVTASVSAATVVAAKLRIASPKPLPNGSGCLK